jgi:hypothetical protein
MVLPKRRSCVREVVGPITSEQRPACVAVRRASVEFGSCPGCEGIREKVESPSPGLEDVGHEDDVVATANLPVREPSLTPR